MRGLRLRQEGIIIRRVVSDDLPVVLSLVRQLAGGVHSRQSNAVIAQAFQGLIDGEAQEGFVATLHQRAIGFISLYYMKVLHYGGLVASIQELVVTEEFRGRGVDQALLEHAKKRARELGCAGLEMACGLRDRPEKAFRCLDGIRPVSARYLPAAPVSRAGAEIL